jgi:hypothetical protein
MNILANIKSMLSDGHNGSVSSKRVVTILAFVLCSTGFIANLFWGFKIDQFIYDSMMFIVVGGLGFTGLEKFAPKAAQ